MAITNSTLITILLTIGVGVFYQLILHDTLFVTFGVNRNLQPISDFPYSCRRITDPALQACEDMWLDDKSRTLYLACSDPLSRRDWMPNIAHFNVSGRGLNDHVVALSIDHPRGHSFSYQILKTPGFYGTHGDGRLHVVGMTGTRSPAGLVELWFINAKPSVDTQGQLLDQASVGANSTIEVFSTKPGSSTMTHARTYANNHIATPNNVAVLEDGSFYFTNDHGSHKAGLQHTLSPILRTGTITYCPSSGSPCKTVSTGHSFPNGLHFSRRDHLLYVPSAVLGSIQVYLPREDGSLDRITKINIPVPIDNLSEDADGVIWAAVIPKMGQMMAGFQDPLKETSSPSGAWKVVREIGVKGNKEEGIVYLAEKVVEDANGQVLPASTTVVRDAKSGRLFFSGVYSPFITVCEKKKI